MYATQPAVSHAVPDTLGAWRVMTSGKSKVIAATVATSIATS